MVAVDTNVLVRLRTNDDRLQSPRAEELFRTKQIFVATTVLLETEWVLRSLYDFDAPAVSEALRGVAGLPAVHLENAGLVAQALRWHDDGIDFADALHMASGGSDFRTFDDRLVKRARRAGITFVRAV